MRIVNKVVAAILLSPGAAFAASSCPTDNLGEQLACNWGIAIDIAIYFSYFLSTVLLITSLMMWWSRTQNPNGIRVSAIVLTFISAGFMLSLSSSLELAQSTIFTNEPVGLFEYSRTIEKVGTSGSTGGITALTASNAKAMIGLIMLIGVVYFIKGIYLISKLTVDQQVTKSKVAAHILGGSACFNILNVSCGLLSFINISSICG
ncbi:hypothetical protein ACTG16_23870 [Aeromonas sp. 23P]|uniref:hypothetical protein n=1 Tax=Aeromonas sp. 23P TaxID=3452716 RepID=UPI003F7A3E2B|nr:hypothetical protein [Aeromonas veronii]